MRELTESGLLVKSERLLKNKEKQAEIVVENQEMNQENQMISLDDQAVGRDQLQKLEKKRGI